MDRRTFLTALPLAPLALPANARAQDGVRVRAEEPLVDSQPQRILPPDGYAELHRLRLSNKRGGPIEVSTDQGRTWRTIGRVVRAATSTAEGHIAAEYAPPGTVAAVAVHGLRMRISADDGTLHAPRLLSIVPREFVGDFKFAGYGGVVAGSSGIGTDIPAGASIFRGLAPLTGNPIFFEEASGRFVPLPTKYLPEGKGETFLIPVWIPKKRLAQVVFENRTGGAVTLTWEDGKTEVPCRVLAPVLGVGRFDGTAYTGVGRLNTAHTGVITVSTAPIDSGLPEGEGRERRGGFQISPAWHNSRCEEAGAPMVMTVGLLDAAGRPDHRLRSVEGVAPLFKDQVCLAGQAPVADCAVDGGPWEPIPTLIGSIPGALTAAGLNAHWRAEGLARTCAKGVTAFRLRLPHLTPQTSEKMAGIAHTEYKKLRLAAAKAGEARIVNGILSLTATPPNAGEISYVRLLVDGRPRGFTNVQPFTLSWDTTTLPDGEYVVEAQALDQNGIILNTSARRVYVLNGK